MNNKGLNFPVVNPRLERGGSRNLIIPSEQSAEEIFLRRQSVELLDLAGRCQVFGLAGHDAALVKGYGCHLTLALSTVNPTPTLNLRDLREVFVACEIISIPRLVILICVLA